MDQCAMVQMRVALALLLLLPLSFAANCLDITSSGSYSLAANADGAPYGGACIRITASNVDFDCNGKTITKDATAGTTYGIRIPNAGTNNVTIRNCPGISQYSRGIEAQAGTSNLSVYNSTANNNTWAGFYFYSSANNTLTNNTAYNNTNHGFYLQSTSSSTLTNNTAYNNTNHGFYLQSTSNNAITHNSAYNNSYSGFYFVTSTNNTLANNSAHNNIQFGFYLTANYNTFASNSAYNNARHGFFLESGSNNTLANNTAYNNIQFGFYIHTNSNSTLSDNSAYNNSYSGFYLYSSSNFNTLSNNSAYNNTYHGFYLDASSNNTLAKNSAHHNVQYGFSLSSNSNFNNLADNSAYNSQDGFHLYSTSNNTLSNNSAYNDSQYGFYLDASSNNILASNTVYNNSYSGFYLLSSSNNTLTNNTAHNNTLYGFYLYSSPNNTLANNTAHNNTNHGFFLQSSSNNALSGNSAYNNTQYGLYLSSSSNNALANTTIHGNGAYAIRFVSSSSNNISGTLIYDQARTFISSGSSGIKLTNLTLESGSASIFFPSVNYSTNQLNSSNLIIESDFVSLDSSAMQEFNTSATITMDIGTCEGFEPSKLLRAEGFHTSKEEILLAGSPCPGEVCTSVQCEGGILTFNVPHFTGYAYGSLANLTIDNNGPAVEGQEISFNASYVNSTSGQHIAGATCTLGLQNGSTYPMGEFASYYESNITVFVPGTHNYNVTCSAAGFDTLTAFDTYQVLGGAPNATITLYGANVTIINTSKYFSNLTAGNITTEGGNISSVNLNSSRSTEKWAGFYGNTTGSLILSEHNASVFMYKWAWDSTLGGTVCVSTNSTLYTFQAAGASASEIGTAWGFSPTDTDSAENTYNGTGCTINFGQANVSGASYAQTGTSGDFRTCALRSAISPSKPEMLFCANITSAGQLFNGGLGDFEIIAPTAQEPGAFETYYFYMSLN